MNDSLSKKENILLSLKTITVIALFLASSAFFGWWGYGLTGRWETWGETIWEKSNWVGALIFGIGITSAILFLFFFLSRMFLKLFGKKAIATLHDVSRKKVLMQTRSDLHRNMDGSSHNLKPFKDEEVTVYSKSFRFTAADGKSYDLESNTETNQDIQEGEKVTVFYLPWRPQKAKIFNHLEFYALVYLFLIMSTVTTVIGAILLELLD